MGVSFFNTTPAPRDKIMAVSIQGGTAFAAGNPQVLFEGEYPAAQDGRHYDVSADGRWFLMIKDARQEDSVPPQLSWS
jgi:hypothetical protein